LKTNIFSFLLPLFVIAQYMDNFRAQYRLILLPSTFANQFLMFFVLFSIYRAVRFAAFLMRKILSNRKKATILFATETGRSEGFARNLAKLMSHSFDVKVCQNRCSKESSLLLLKCLMGSSKRRVFSTPLGKASELQRYDCRDTQSINVWGGSVAEWLGSRTWIEFCSPRVQVSLWTLSWNCFLVDPSSIP